MRDEAIQEGGPTAVRACPRCGAALPGAGALFCSGCQHPIPAELGPASGASRTDPELRPGLWDHLALFNGVGFAMMAACLWPIALVCHLLGDPIKEPRSALLLGGAALVVVDLRYRLKSITGHWLIPHRGGKILWLPAWVMGFVWIGLGFWRLMLSVWQPLGP